jgi:hypothetical protein
MTLIYYITKYDNVILHHVDRNLLEMGKPRRLIWCFDIKEFYLEARLIGEL